MWAPSVIKVGNQYNYYYALSTWGDPNPGVGVATSSTPYGPWIDHGKILDSVDSGVKNSIDPQALYVDGKLYLVWGSFFGIGIIELTEDGLEPYVGYSNLKEYTKYIIKDNTTNGKMDIDINYEGSYIIEKDNKFYYFGSNSHHFVHFHYSVSNLLEFCHVVVNHNHCPCFSHVSHHFHLLPIYLVVFKGSY